MSEREPGDLTLLRWAVEDLVNRCTAQEEAITATVDYVDALLPFVEPRALAKNKKLAKLFAKMTKLLKTAHEWRKGSKGYE